MAIATTASSATHNIDSRAFAVTTGGRTWSSYLFHVLAVSGALTVITGSYMSWATFYAGLISRNGVPGHGKYFIGLAAATIAVAVLSVVRGVTPAVRWLVLPAGAAIAWFAFRDLQNLNDLIADPASGLYVPGRGQGLYVVIAGSLVMAASVFASASVPRPGLFSVQRTLAALAFAASIATLVPALYGEYYMHLSTAHIHDHGAFNTIHVLNIAGALLLFIAFRLAVTGLKRPAR